MACLAENNICFIAGDDVQYNLQHVEDDGITPIDLTGSVAVMELRDGVTNAAVAQLMSGGIVSATLGQMQFTLTDVQSAALLPRAESTNLWNYSVKLTYSDSTEQTLVGGTFTLDQAATE